MATKLSAKVSDCVMDVFKYIGCVMEQRNGLFEFLEGKNVLGDDGWWWLWVAVTLCFSLFIHGPLHPSFAYFIVIKIRTLRPPLKHVATYTTKGLLVYHIGKIALQWTQQICNQIFYLLANAATFTCSILYDKFIILITRMLLGPITLFTAQT